MEIHRAIKPRPHSELVMRLIRPIARWGIAWLARFGVDPQHVVLTHGLLGLTAAALIASDGLSLLWVAGFLLIGKVVLDNIDGGLARATARVTKTGRYLDTLVDLAVNAALFAALALHGSAFAALLGLMVLTVVLSVDYNLQRLYEEARAVRTNAVDGVTADVPIGAPPRVYAALRGAYRLLLAPQDELIAKLDRWTHARVVASAPGSAGEDTRAAWNDHFSTAAVVNLGLSTQLTVLAGSLFAGRPYFYVWLVLLQAPYLLCVWLLRIWRFREYLRNR